jgi:heme/copper-type cytochrome/quinol oxidase subunit 2
MRTLEYIYDPMRVDFKDVLIKKDETEYSWLTDIMILVFVALIVAVVLFVASRFCWRYWKMYRKHEGYRVHEE